MTGSRVFLWMTLLALVSLGVWSMWAPLDVVTVSKGEVKPVSDVKRVGHLDKGIVAAINVSEGDVVKKDEVLVELDPTQAETSVDELSARIAALRIRRARLTAVVNDREQFEVSDELKEAAPHLAAEAQALFVVSRRQHAREVAAQREVIRQKRESIAALDARLRGSRESKEALGELISISRELREKNVTSRMEHLRLMRKETDLQARIAETEASLEKARAELKEAREKLKGLQAKHQENARTELAKTKGELSALIPRHRRLVEARNRTKLRAPVDGVVKQLKVNTVGGIIRPREPVVTVVPSDAELVIEASLPSQEVGFVARGQPVRIRLAGAAGSRFQAIHGTVTRIAPDAQVTKKGSAFYKVRIKPDSTSFRSERERYVLLPGVRVVCSIVTGQRTVASYLLDPWLQGMGRAFQER